MDFLARANGGWIFPGFIRRWNQIGFRVQRLAGAGLYIDQLRRDLGY